MQAAGPNKIEAQTRISSKTVAHATDSQWKRSALLSAGIAINQHSFACASRLHSLCVFLSQSAYSSFYLVSLSYVFKMSVSHLPRSCICPSNIWHLCVKLNRVVFNSDVLLSEFLSVDIISTAAMPPPSFSSQRSHHDQRFNSQRLAIERGTHSYAQNLLAPVGPKSLFSILLCTAAILCSR